MPYVNIQITKGASRAQKAQLVREVTESLVRVLGKRPEHIHIVLQEIEEEDWGFAGLLTDDWKRQQDSTMPTLSDQTPDAILKTQGNPGAMGPDL
ncbi:MAG: 4-oxalocrotonate tautomerase family protein [Leptolyngbyaceae cyanobacterium]